MILAILYFEVVQPTTVLRYELALFGCLEFINLLRVVASFAAIVRKFSHAL